MFKAFIFKKKIIGNAIILSMAGSCKQAHSHPQWQVVRWINYHPDATHFVGL
jgi:hypothetical protein